MVADIWATRQYQAHLAKLGMNNITRRSLGARRVSRRHAGLAGVLSWLAPSAHQVRTTQRGRPWGDSLTADDGGFFRALRDGKQARESEQHQPPAADRTACFAAAGFTTIAPAESSSFR